METFVKGDIAVIPFPFSDLSASKKRPAFVVTALSGKDLILCQITSKETFDEYAISLKEKELLDGTLHQDSCVRPNKLFTADSSLIQYKIGHLKDSKTKEIIEKIIEIIKK